MANKDVSCPAEVTLKVIGGRWKALIVYYLLQGTKRFNQLQRELKGISHRTLSRQLQEMIEHQLVMRKDYNETPPRVEYSLTPLGLTLKPILMAMEKWGAQFKQQFPEFDTKNEKHNRLK